MTRYLVGIDNGSQSTTVTVFDASGREVAEGRQALRGYDMPRRGVVEHPDDDLWDSIGAASRAAMTALAEGGGDPSDIVGVGLCTIRFCRAVLRDDGRLAQPVMSWMDERLDRPFRAESPDVARVTTSSGYIGWRMTGRPADSAANQAGRWPIDPLTWEWSTDDAAYANTGLTRDLLVDLVMPGDVLGELTGEAARHTGLPPGVPVVATANDKAVEALGAGLADPRTLLLSLGTYSAGMAVGTEHIAEATSLWTNFAAVPHTYLYESAGVRRGMWTVSWLRDLLGTALTTDAEAAGMAPEELLDREAGDVPAGSDGLVTVLDWLAPTEAPFRRGSVLGFDARHGRAHLHRSILEGLVLTLASAGADMAAELGTAVDQVVVTGGGSRSDLVLSIIADVAGLPTRRAERPDAAGLGAAICAAVGTDVHPDVDAAIAAMTRPGPVVDPDHATHDRYARLGEVHRQVRDRTDPLYRQLADLTGEEAAP